LSGSSFFIWIYGSGHPLKIFAMGIDEEEGCLLPGKEDFRSGRSPEHLGISLPGHDPVYHRMTGMNGQWCESVHSSRLPQMLPEDHF